MSAAGWPAWATPSMLCCRNCCRLSNGWACNNRTATAGICIDDLLNPTPAEPCGERNGQNKHSPLRLGGCFQLIGSAYMDIIRLIAAILLPPLGVFLQVGLGGAFWLNILLTLFGYLPGIIHAVWIIARR